MTIKELEERAKADKTPHPHAKIVKLIGLLRQFEAGLLDIEERCYNSRTEISTKCRLLLNKLEGDI